MTINSDQLFNILWYTDSRGVKVSHERKNTQVKVASNKVKLDEIPDPYYKVFINGYSEINISAEITSTNQFKVNYDIGEILFHPTVDGSTINVDKFYARGKFQLYAKNLNIINKNGHYQSDNVEDFANEISTQVNNLVSSSGNSNLEVYDSRYDPVDGVTYSTLKERLDAKANKISQLNNNLNQRSVNVRQPPYNAKGDGLKGIDGAVIQQAINDVFNSGGGTVYIPYTRDGYYLEVRLTIPKGVLLEAGGTPSAAYLSGGTSGLGYFQKAYFIMDEFTGIPNATNHVISLVDNASIDGFGFYYKTTNTQITTGTPPVFPFAIYASGYGCHITNLSVVGASHFISIGAFERGYINNIYGFATQMLFRIRRSKDVSRIQNIHMNMNIVFPNHSGSSESWSDYFKDWVKNNLVAFRMGGADIIYLENIVTVGTKTAIEFASNNEVDGLGTAFDDQACNIIGNNMLFDNTQTGIHIKRAIAWGIKITNLDIVPIADDGSGVAIKTSDNASGHIDISNFFSKGDIAKTRKHISVGGSTIRISIKNMNLKGLGDNTSRGIASMDEIFEVLNSNSSIHAEITNTKTNSLGQYRTVIYDTRSTQFPNGFQIENFGIQEDLTGTAPQLLISSINGSDSKSTMFGIDRVTGGISSKYLKDIIAGATDTYDLRGNNNSNGRGLIIVTCGSNLGNVSAIIHCDGNNLYGLTVGTNVAVNNTNLDTANKLNIYLSSTGVIGMKNNLASTAKISIVYFPGSR